jgi:hypothetical protein
MNAKGEPMRKVVVAGLALAVAGCATQGPGLRIAPLPAPAAPPPASRLAAIYGHGAYRTPAGVRGTCAGQSVALMHETVTYRRRIVALYGSSEHALLPVAEVQSRSAKIGASTENPLVESAQCAADGGFAFKGLQPGPYFLIARTHQGHAAPPADQYVVMMRVVVNEGEARDLNLNP